MRGAFSSTDILLPKVTSYEAWAVIAVDQFTSDYEYWKRVESFVGDENSTLRMVLPEIFLEHDAQDKIRKISDTMIKYVNDDVFQNYPMSFIYVERTLLDGSIRPGIVGVIDLEQYHYDPANQPVVGATEQTILERVPPRIAIRKEAELEFSHVILFCKDYNDQIFAPITAQKDSLTKIYDFMLMENGGHISGWLIQGESVEKLETKLFQYQSAAEGTAYLVADGNHSLVTAKCWYEELKRTNPGVDYSNHPARFALVELENILDPSIVFEPIHRVLFDVDAKKFLEDLKQLDDEVGCEISWISGEQRGTVRVPIPEGELPVAVLQNHLDKWMSENDGRIDYIHDAEAVESFANKENAVGLLLPVFDKDALFAFGAAGKILPRKTFSLGHGREKRYYLEGRKIR